MKDRARKPFRGDTSRSADLPAKSGDRSGQSGRPLDHATRSFMERRFGHDFSRIRIHADEDAATANESEATRAFTVDSDIWMDERTVRGDTRKMRHLIAHELAHSIQQNLGGTPSSTPSAEGEAATAAALAADGGPAHVGLAAPRGVAQASPLSDEIDAAHLARNKGGVFNLLRARGPLTLDADSTAWLDRVFGPNSDPAKLTDDRWLADTIIQYGTEPMWPFTAFEARARLARVHNWPAEPGNIEGAFSLGQGRAPIKAYYFRGISDRRAMIIAGVHGSELGGVEVVERLLAKMRAPNAPMPFFSVIVIPQVFPRNVAAARRKTTDTTPDPNRQMPAVGATPGTTTSLGGPMERENQILLDIVGRFQPERLASVHGTTKRSLAGVTSDPRPGRAAEDDALSLAMARRAAAGGTRVPGNKLGTPQETVRYPTSTEPHEAGVTFGQYGSQAAASRPAMNMILIETSGNERSTAPGDARGLELESLASVLRDIFLGDPSAVTP
jgi:uncharacterized protein DUF4157